MLMGLSLHPYIQLVHRTCIDQLAFVTPCSVQVTNGDRQRMEGLKAWLVSKDAKQLSADLKKIGGALSVHMDGHKVSLKEGRHFSF